jgi:hypothetical protein
VSSCECGNEPSGSIKCWETTEWLHNLWPLERYSAPQLVSASEPLRCFKTKTAEMAMKTHLKGTRGLSANKPGD